jgi:hypothetical protein
MKSRFAAWAALAGMIVGALPAWGQRSFSMTAADAPRLGSFQAPSSASAGPAPGAGQMLGAWARDEKAVREKLRLAAIGRGVGPEDWIIGDAPPDETVVITQDMAFSGGDLYIINNGVLEIQGARLTVRGEIFAGGNGRLSVLAGGSLTLDQDFAYHRRFVFGDNSSFEATNAEIRTLAGSAGVGMLNAATATFQQAAVAEGFLTWGLFDQAAVSIAGSDRPGEFLPLGAPSLSFQDTESFLMWIAVPEGATIDATLPDGAAGASWTLNPLSPFASGIPYSVSIANCSDVLWATAARSGGSAIFRDSQMRVAGALWEHGEAVAIKGLCNEAQLADQSYGWGDISLRFINSSVQTWNLYTFGEANLTLERCLVGEVQANDSSSVDFGASMCDGTGGYLSALGQSEMTLAFATNLSQTTVRDNATLVAGESALLSSAIDADGNAIMVLANVCYKGEPAAQNAAVLADARVEPAEGPAGPGIPIRGTARLLKGPNSPVAFVDYVVEYGIGIEPLEWFPIGQPSDRAVRDGVLATWDATGLAPGIYTVRLRLRLSTSDEIAVTAQARLFAPELTAASGERWVIR